MIKMIPMSVALGALLVLFELPSAFDGCMSDSQCGKGYQCAGGECLKNPEPPPPPPKKGKKK
jgi:hypothetical protein